MFKRIRNAARKIASKVKGAVRRVFGKKKKDKDVATAKGGRG
jgi:hypothetical protein|nr:MAG TPA: hypothetical protein [Caudoviricetes sp.]